MYGRQTVRIVVAETGCFSGPKSREKAARESGKFWTKAQKTPAAAKGIDRIGF